MAKASKILAIAENSPSNVKFDDLCSLAEHYGWEFQRQTGSHKIYFNAEIGLIMNFQPAKDGKAKVGQVKQLLDAIKELE